CDCGCGAIGNIDTAHGIRPIVMNQRTANSQDVALIISSDLGIPVLIALLCGGNKMLTPIFNPFNKPAKQSCRQANDGFFLVKHQFRPKCASQVWRDNTYLVSP